MRSRQMPGGCPSYFLKMQLVSGQLDDNDCNEKKINTVFPTILKVEFCLGIDKEEDKRCAVFVYTQPGL